MQIPYVQRQAYWRRIALTPTVAVFLLLSVLPLLNLAALSVHNVRWEEGRA